MSDLSGKWIIGILVYYVFFFIIITGITTAQLELLGSNDYNVTVTNAGFDNSSYYTGQTTSGGYCSGTSSVYTTYWDNPFANQTNYVMCEDLKLNYGNYGLIDESQCTSIGNCSIENRTSWFGLVTSNYTLCKGNVNLSYYNLSQYDRFNVCTSPIIVRSSMNCQMFGCVWTNLTNTPLQSAFNNKCKDAFCAIYEGVKNIFDAISSFLSTVVWMLTFQADVGLGAWNWLFILIFFYVPLVMLLYAIATIWK